MNRLVFSLVMLAWARAQAQTTLAPTPERPKSEIDLGNYKVTDAFEVGFRLNAVGGDVGLFRSNVNYGNGLRLLSNSFTANSKDGHGGLFDSMLISTQGLGNDPYGVANARVEKNGRYRYDGIWRRSEYYNPFQINGESGNLKTTRRELQDHDLTISAAKWMKFRLGYSRNQETGPADSSYELYIGGLYPDPSFKPSAAATHSVSELALLRDTRRDSNEFRLGGDIDFAGFRLTILRQLSYYKDDSAISPLLPGLPYPLVNTSVATAYQRSEPMHVQTPAWFANLTTARKFWAMNSRITYMKADSRFTYEETGTGTVPTGAIGNVSTLYNGAVRQPSVSGDLSLSFFPAENLSIVSNTSAQQNRIDGTASSLQLSTAAAAKNIFYYSYLDIARVSESLDLTYRITKWLALNANYLYTDRVVDQVLKRAGTTNGNAPGSLSNHLNAETLGFRLKPLKSLSINLDAGLGRDNSPYTPVSLANYHTLRGRIDYKLRKLRLSGIYRQLYNLNAPVLYSYDASHSREISFSSSYELRRKWGLDASYSNLHRNAFSSIFAELPVNGVIANVRGYNSVYLSNVHSLSIMSRVTFKQATLFAGYSLTRDSGDGRAIQNLGLQNAAAAFLANTQTFPMSYQAPLARLSIRISPKVQWNAGWEFYRYNQQFAYFSVQPYYRAHTGYTSLSFTY